MKSIILFLTLLAPLVSATGLRQCDSVIEQTVFDKVKGNSAATKYFIPFEISKKYKEYCQSMHEDIMDGLEYIVYKNEESGTFRIVFYNYSESVHTIYSF